MAGEPLSDLLCPRHCDISASGLLGYYSLPVWNGGRWVFVCLCSALAMQWQDSLWESLLAPHGVSTLFLTSSAISQHSPETTLPLTSAQQPEVLGQGK